MDSVRGRKWANKNNYKKNIVQPTSGDIQVGKL